MLGNDRAVAFARFRLQLRAIDYRYHSSPALNETSRFQLADSYRYARSPHAERTANALVGKPELPSSEPILSSQQASGKPLPKRMPSITHGQLRALNKRSLHVRKQ
jgi:hypothetical protein